MVLGIHHNPSCIAYGDARYQHIHPFLRRNFQIELLHDQLPLAVPCYDLLPVNELTVGPHKRDFGYSHLP